MERPRNKASHHINSNMKIVTFYADYHYTRLYYNNIITIMRILSNHYMQHVLYEYTWYSVSHQYLATTDTWLLTQGTGRSSPSHMCTGYHHFTVVQCCHANVFNNIFQPINYTAVFSLHLAEIQVWCLYVA